MELRNPSRGMLHEVHCEGGKSGLSRSCPHLQPRTSDLDATPALPLRLETGAVSGWWLLGSHRAGAQASGPRKHCFPPHRALLFAEPQLRAFAGELPCVWPVLSERRLSHHFSDFSVRQGLCLVLFCFFLTVGTAWSHLFPFLPSC